MSRPRIARAVRRKRATLCRDARVPTRCWNPPLFFRTLSSGTSGERDVINDDGIRPDRNLPQTGQVEFHELDPISPNLAQKVLEDLNSELLAGATPVSEPERGKSRIIADRQWLAVDDAEDGAEPAVGEARLATVGDIEGRNVEGAPGKANLLAFGFVDLIARRRFLIAIRVELLRVLPVTGIEAGARYAACLRSHGARNARPAACAAIRRQPIAGRR